MPTSPMFGASRHVTLQVTAEGGAAAFDALVILDGRRGFASQTYSARRTPFHGALRPIEEILRRVGHPSLLTRDAARSGGSVAAHGVHPLNERHPVEDAGTRARYDAE